MWTSVVGLLDASGGLCSATKELRSVCSRPRWNVGRVKASSASSGKGKQSKATQSKAKHKQSKAKRSQAEQSKVTCDTRALG